jgi:hypothetical protein
MSIWPFVAPSTDRLIDYSTEFFGSSRVRWGRKLEIQAFTAYDWEGRSYETIPVAVGAMDRMSDHGSEEFLQYFLKKESEAIQIPCCQYVRLYPPLELVHFQ